MITLPLFWNSNNILQVSVKLTIFEVLCHLAWHLPCNRRNFDWACFFDRVGRNWILYYMLNFGFDYQISIRKGLRHLFLHLRYAIMQYLVSLLSLFSCVLTLNILLIFQSLVSSSIKSITSCFFMVTNTMTWLKF